MSSDEELFSSRSATIPGAAERLPVPEPSAGIGGAAVARSAVYRLYYGSVERPLATVVPDSRWPGMWRIAWPDGELSDLGNLSRVKDAAEVTCATGRDSALLHWKRHACERALEASWSGWSRDGA